MKKYFLLLIVCVILLSLPSCKKKTQDKETAFQNLYHGIEFNKDIILIKDPLGANYGFLGCEIDLILQNQSSRKVNFDISKDVAIYTYSEKQQKWIQVINKFTYNPGEETINPKGTEDITNTLVFVAPKIFDFNTAITFRVVAIGHLQNNENETTEVGAYYDTKLVPMN